MAQTLLIAELGRLLMGFSAAFAFVGALKLATENNVFYQDNYSFKQLPTFPQQISG